MNICEEQLYLKHGFKCWRYSVDKIDKYDSRGVYYTLAGRDEQKTQSKESISGNRGFTKIRQIVEWGFLEG